jgi:hypothetical protein
MTGFSKCLICTHDKRLEYERMYCQGKSIAHISRISGVGYDSVSNHMKEHLSRQLVQAWQKKEAMASMDILGEIESLISRTKSILDTAEQKGRYGLALSAIGEARQGYELLCKIAVALHETRRDELSMNRAVIEQEIEQETNARIGEMLEVLNDNEVSLLHALNVKMISRDADLVVIPINVSDQELLQKIKQFLPMNFSETKPLRRTSCELSSPAIERRLKRTKFPQNDEKPSKVEPEQEPAPDPELEKMKVRPIKPQQIEFTPWSEHPSNPCYHLRKHREKFDKY